MTPDIAFSTRALFLACASLVGLSLLVLTVCVVVLMVRARARLAREAASAAARPILQKAMVDYLAGGSDTSVLRAHLATQREDVAEILMLFQGTVRGSARDRLCNLTLDFSLAHEWCKETRSGQVVRRRTAYSRLAFTSVYEPVRHLTGDLMRRGLNDTDTEIRLAAARSLIQCGGEDDLKHVFELALTPNLLTRAVLTEDLRPHAMALCEGPVRQILRSDQVPRVRALLEMLVAWERSMPLEDVREFLDHRDRPIRVLAFRMAPLVPANFETRLALVRALNESDAEIRTLAVIAVGRLKMADALPELVRCMRDGDLTLARRAAEAIAGIPRGPETLEELAAGSNAQTARVAAEELARRRTG